MDKIMSEQVDTTEVMPLISIISSDDELRNKAGISLEAYFGRAGLVSELFKFDLSDYYEDEMGTELTRRWYSYEVLQDASLLVEWKHFCVEIENSLLDTAGNRRVNIDPGYLDYGKLVLASFKSAPDKIYMGRGVWAHTCLRYGHGLFTAPDHSFPDFIDGRFNTFMIEARGNYRRIVRSSGE